jgi:hypothetical protein
MKRARSRLDRMQVRLGAFLTAFAIALRIMIPAGYMVAPTQDKAGLPAIVICTAQGAKVISVEAGGDVQSGDSAPHPADDKNKSDHGCVFAGAVAPLPVPSQTLADARALIAISRIDLPVGHQRPGLGLAAPPPFKTGPPELV